MKYCALTIAGSDSGGGAGIQADLKTFAALGVYGTSVITAVTAQNSNGVQAVQELDEAIVRSQIQAVLSDIDVGAVKIGMLLNESIINAVGDTLSEFPTGPIVADTVMISKSGRHLLLPEAVEVFKRRIIPLADVLTPNLPEAETLTGFTVNNKESMIEAAKRLHELGAKYVVVKGGHLTDGIVDILYDGYEVSEFSAPRIENIHTHGTGCTFSSAIAAGLSKGSSVRDAVGQAREYMNMAIQYGFKLGAGIGPLHHFKALYQAAKINNKDF